MPACPNIRCKALPPSTGFITCDLAVVNQRLMSPSLGDLAEWLCKAFRVPGQNFFGWRPSGMARSFISRMAITNDLPSVFCWVSQMASI
jgi:hypothetical protein